MLFYFCQKPRLPITSNQEINFAFLLVSQVAKFKLSQAHIILAFDGLKQVTGDKRFCFVSLVFYRSPIAQKPFRFLAE